MRLLTGLCLLFCLLCGCAPRSGDLYTAIQGRWMKGNDGWVMFMPEGLVCRVDDRAQVGTYAIVDDQTIVVEEFSGDATVRNLWKAEITPKGLDLTYPGNEKVSYGRPGKEAEMKHKELVGLWSSNLGVGKTNLYAFDAGGRFLAVRWIRSSSQKDSERKQRRVVEAGHWKVKENKLLLDGVRRRHFDRTYEFSVTGNSMVLTSGKGVDRKTRTYLRGAQN